MIEVTLTELAVTLITVTLLVITLSALSVRLSEALRHARLSRIHLLCRVCGYHWQDKTKAKLVDCPHCDRKVERNGPRSLG